MDVKKLKSKQPLFTTEEDGVDILKIIILEFGKSLETDDYTYR
jgi:hypothetical protein